MFTSPIIIILTLSVILLSHLQGHLPGPGAGQIIDIALEFGYDSPDSFTKAFVRFHGLTPAALRKSGGAVRSFAPLRIKLTLEGGQNMDCKIMKKEAFTVLCRAKTFKYEDAAAQVPQFWAEHFGTGGGKVVCGMYGINLGSILSDLPHLLNALAEFCYLL